ncbi:MAG: ribosome biogenesis/translation initiation ATPase RLI [Euryarchaeota archaeon]|nr:ribosome biogenesis/translation initiation ATPase RLI [Euryarchaeota archaeon]
MARIAVLLTDRCHPKQCQGECQAYCPPVRMGQECIVWGEGGKPVISETLCIGCGICVHKCPFTAIKILNTPEAAEAEMVHRYGLNSFRLYRLPVPRPKGVVGMIGPNGIGKSTALRVISGVEQPNLGRYEEPPAWEEVIRRYRGTELQPHFLKLSKGELRTVIKPQYVDTLAEESGSRSVGQFVDEAKGDTGKVLDETGLKGREEVPLKDLSGGELQLASLARTLATTADLYLLDEPSNYLDIVHRLRVARIIRALGDRASVVVVEHDLALLDYLADQAHLVYGEEAAFGVITRPMPMRTAINTYLQGYLQDENVRFRTEPIVFTTHPPKPAAHRVERVRFGALEKDFPLFHLSVSGGSLHKGEVVGVVGPNSTGKTTFVKMLAGVEVPSQGTPPAGVSVAYKPQYLRATGDWTLKERVESLSAGGGYNGELFQKELVPALRLGGVLEVPLTELSGGELQLAAIALCMGRPATLYLLDEPSAYLDSDQRMNIARLIKRLVEREGTTALVVDHDVYFLDLVADSLMTFKAEDAEKHRARGDGPFTMRQGMNELLEDIEVTFRRDEESHRPRINKEGSVLDREQRSKGEYYYEAAA